MAKTKPKPSVPYKYKTRVLKEQDEAPTPPCPEGWHETDGKCVKDEPVTEQEHECGEGEHWSEAEGKCVKDAPVTEQDVPAPITDETPIEQPEVLPAPPLECGDGFHLEDGACVPDDVVPAQEPEPEMPPVSTAEAAPSIKTAWEMTATETLSLGEPFADYSSFEDCVSKNSDKGDPEAYCASIKRETEGEIVVQDNVYEAQKATNEGYKQLRNAQAKRNRHFAIALNKLGTQYTSLGRHVQALPKAINAAFKEGYNARREEDRKLYMEIGKLRAEKKAAEEQYAKHLSQLATAQAKLRQDLITEIRKRVAVDKKLEENISGTTHDFEKLLALADKNAADLTSHLKTLETRNNELEQQQAEAEKKKVTETAKLAERMDNMEAKMKGQYKGANKPLDSQAGDGNDELGAASPYT